MGENLSWNKHITKVELRNICGKGRLHLTDAVNGKSLSWEVDASSKTTFTLTPEPPVNTNSLPN